MPDGCAPSPSSTTSWLGLRPPTASSWRRGKVTVEELQRWTLLVREPGSSTRAVAERYLARAGYHPTNRWELDSNEAIKRSVQAGLGVGFVSKLVARDEVERRELVEFRIDGAEPMRRSIHLPPAERDPTPSERAFISSLNDCCAVTIDGCRVGGSNPKR